ncbi:MAG: prepilin-type N-terminal cleavage/methylation domain-containing protein [Oscillospiraceae bacterium]|nr:prepilin-type N-terminal cleavage/methylation domain-containing protein [Oscillospiraceae bacterium]
MIQKLKKSNAGFTLVELIVVIAILGILTAVLVPQYIQYIEKSRVAADNNMAATLLSEVQNGIVIAGESNITYTDGTIKVSAGSCVDSAAAAGIGVKVLAGSDPNWATARVKNTKGTPGLVYTITYSSTGATGAWGAT